MLSYLPPLLPPQQGEPMRFDILEVSSRWTARSVARTPWLVYRDDPYWTPPLLADRRRAIELLRVAAGQAGRSVPEAGMFYVESRSLTAMNPVTGSLVVWPRGDGSAGFGLFETINHAELAQSLLERGETWLFEHIGAVTAIRGPLSLQPLQPPGVLVDGFAERPGGLLPYSPPYYPDTLGDAGYAPVAEWVSYVADLADRGARRPARLPSSPPDAALWRLLEGSYQELAGELIPGLQDVIDEFARLGRVVTTRLSRQGRCAATVLFRQALIAVSQAGAACLAVPDPGEALRWAKGSLLPVGWAPFRLALARARRLHVFPAVAGADGLGVPEVYAAIFAQARACGYTSAVIAPIEAHDIASARALADQGARLSHRYAIYEKSFEDAPLFI